ncbi:MAG: ubiquitin-like domain-containing protein [Micromonosporaceae bacterium]
MSVPHTTRLSRRRSQQPRGRLRWLPQTLAIVLLIGGIAGYLGGTTAVRLVDDGAGRTVRTYASTVKGLLHHTGITLAAHDAVTPAATSRIQPDTTVEVRRGRPVTLTLDGVTKRRWVTTRTVGELVDTLGLGDGRIQLSAPPETAIGRDGMRLTVRTHKKLVLKADGEQTELTTFAATPKELLAERGLALEGRDEVKPALHATLAGAKEVRLIRVKVKPKRETVELKPPTKTKKNDEWMVDQELTIDPGKTGKADQQVEYIYRDGKYSERKVITSKTLVEPKPRVVRKGTKPYPKDDTGLNWDALADCESGGNPRSVSSGGTYHGLYQFNVDMWQRMGGIGLPSQATPREQTYRAILLYKRAGADQWPHCGPRLFS